MVVFRAANTFARLKGIAMFATLAAVTRDRHAKKKVKPIDSFSFAKGFNIASIMVNEFARSAAIYPVVFLEDAQAKEFRPVVLLGLENGENLFVDDSGRWHASYVPAIIRRYPFALAQSGQQGQFTVCIDEGSPLVQEAEGAALFDDKGEPTAVIDNVKRYLGELQKMDAVTRGFCKYLQDNGFLVPLSMRVQRADRVRNIQGCHFVDEKKLIELPDDQFLELRRRGYLAPIYSHLGSLAQMERLMMLKDERETGPKGAKPGLEE
jgi:hypothetical protein